MKWKTKNYFIFGFILHLFFYTKTIIHNKTITTTNGDIEEEKKNYVFSLQLIPLVVVIGVGGALAAGISIRLLTQSPDVTLARNRNPEPWEKYRNKQYKVSKRRRIWLMHIIRWIFITKLDTSVNRTQSNFFFLLTIHFSCTHQPLIIRLSNVQLQITERALKKRNRFKFK